MKKFYVFILTVSIFLCTTLYQTSLAENVPFQKAAPAKHSSTYTRPQPASNNNKTSAAKPNPAPAKNTSALDQPPVKKLVIYVVRTNNNQNSNKEFVADQCQIDQFQYFNKLANTLIRKIGYYHMHSHADHYSIYAKLGKAGVKATPADIKIEKLSGNKYIDKVTLCAIEDTFPYEEPMPASCKNNKGYSYSLLFVYDYSYALRNKRNAERIVQEILGKDFLFYPYRNPMTYDYFTVIDGYFTGSKK